MGDLLPIRYTREGEEPVAAEVEVLDAERALRLRQALEARAHGFEYYQIAETMQVTERAARQLVQDGLEMTVREPADEVRKLELKRIDMLMQVYMQKAMEGHGPSCDRVIMLMERRDRIEGIDAPMELDFAAIRSQFFGALQQAAGPELTAQVLQRMSELR